MNSNVYSSHANTIARFSGMGLASQAYLLAEHRPAGGEVDEGRSALSVDRRVAKGVHEVLAALECRDVRVGVADLPGGVGVRDADGPNVVLFPVLADELHAAHDVALEGCAGVECLNDVHVRQDVNEGGQGDVLAAESVEWVGNLDDAACP